MWVEWFITVEKDAVPLKVDKKYPYWKYELDDKWHIKQYLPFGINPKEYWFVKKASSISYRVRIDIIYSTPFIKPLDFEEGTMYLRLSRNTKDVQDKITSQCTVISDKDIKEFKLETPDMILEHVNEMFYDQFDYNTSVYTVDEFRILLNTLGFSSIISL